MTQEHTVTETTEYVSSDGNTETVIHTVTETGGPDAPEVVMTPAVEEPTTVVVVAPESDERITALESALSEGMNELRASLSDLRSILDSLPRGTPEPTESGEKEEAVTPPPPSPERVPQRQHIYRSLPSWL